MNRFREAVQTISLFGGQRVVWLKDVNFLADTVTGRAESTLQQVEELQALLAGVNPDEVAVVITAAPVDRRRSFVKWCETTADFTLVGDEGREGGAALERVVLAEAAAQGATHRARTRSGCCWPRSAPTPGCSSRRCASWPTYAGEGGTIEEAHVEELTPNFAEGDFFEAAEAFLQRRPEMDAGRAAPALLRRRRRPAGHHARCRTATACSCRSACCWTRARCGSGRAGWTRRASSARRRPTGGISAGRPEKSSFNVFTQNLWYLGKLAGQRPAARAAPADRQPAGVHHRLRGDHPPARRAGGGAAGDGGALPGSGGIEAGGAQSGLTAPRGRFCSSYRARVLLRLPAPFSRLETTVVQPGRAPAGENARTPGGGAGHAGGHRQRPRRALRVAARAVAPAPPCAAVQHRREGATSSSPNLLDLSPAGRGEEAALAITRHSGGRTEFGSPESIIPAEEYGFRARLRFAAAPRNDELVFTHHRSHCVDRCHADKSFGLGPNIGQ